MDQDTIQKLARAHAMLISKYSGVTSAEGMQIAGAIMGYLMQSEVTQGPTSNVTITRAPVQSSEADNPGEGSTLSRAGYRCYCRGCKADIYELSVDIKSRNMGVNALLRAFRPLGNAPKLTRDNLVVLKDNTGNTYIDCPVCKGDKTLLIVGQPNKEDAAQDIAPPVGSVGEDAVTL